METREKNGEFVPTVPSQETLGSQVALHKLAHILQHLISHIVSKCIINGLVFIDIEQYKRYWLTPTC
ncbi:hypothetical protein D3C71_965840 [compost metagenome]